MFASNIGATYAPELKLEGVVAGAPPSQFALIYNFLLTSPYRFYLFMAAGGFNAAYGNKAAPLAAVLTPKAMSLLPDLEKGCSGYLQTTLDKFPIKSLVKANPYDVPAWKKVLQANDPANFTTPSTVPPTRNSGKSDPTSAAIPSRSSAGKFFFSARSSPTSAATAFAEAPPSPPCTGNRFSISMTTRPFAPSDCMVFSTMR